MYEAYRKGLEAFYKGHGLEMYPYHFGSKEYDLWVEGWFDAQKQRRDRI